MNDKIDLDKKAVVEEPNLTELSSPDPVTADLMSSGIRTTQETETLKQKFGAQEDININERLNSKPQLDPDQNFTLKDLSISQETRLNPNPDQNLKSNLKGSGLSGVPTPTTPYPPTILDRFMNFVAYLIKKLEQLLLGFFKKKEPEKVIFHKINEVLDLSKKKKKKKKKKDDKPSFF